MKVQWLSEKQRSYPALWETTLRALQVFARSRENSQVRNNALPRDTAIARRKWQPCRASASLAESTLGQAGAPALQPS